MSPRVEKELALLRQRWPELECVENSSGCWVRLASYAVPPGWSEPEVDVAFRIPGEAATQPYGFYVRPALLVMSDGNTTQPSNYTNPASEQPPFGDGWAMFSWSPTNGWHPQDNVVKGDNMTHFARSFVDRLMEAS